MQIPEDLQGKRDLFRALRNVREPKPVSEEFLRLQDEELQAQLQEKGIVELIDIVGVCRGCVISLFWQKLLFDYQIVTNRKMPIFGLLTHPLQGNNCRYGRATSPVSAWMPSSTPPMRRCWAVSTRCTDASTMPSIPRRACSCARNVTG